VHEANCLELQANFEGRECIYMEGMIWRVRISNIQFNLEEKFVKAIDTEIPTKGLLRSREPVWDIGAGYLTYFSANSWATSYGMWNLNFDPLFIETIVKEAASWPPGFGTEKINRRVHKIRRQFTVESQTNPLFEDRGSTTVLKELDS
jgi:hypothetical protein